jgi:hypothetical protein
MRSPSIPAVALVALAIGACGDGSLSARAGGTGGIPSSGGTGGAVPVGSGGTSAVLSSGGASGATGPLSTETGGASTALASGGVVGAGGSPATGTGGASMVPSSGGAGGASVVPSADGASETDAALAGGAEVAPSTGGVVGIDAALATGGAAGTVDVREGDTVADGIGEAGGASGGKNVLDLVPLDNTVGGWKVDRTLSSSPGQRAMTATTEEGVENLIDGGAIAFFLPPYRPKVFAMQYYVNSTLPAAPDGAHVILYIVQMPSAEQAAGLYKAVLGLSEYSRRVGTPDDWQDPTTPRLGADSRIQDTGSSWWINFYKDVFYVEVVMDPSYGPPPDYNPGNTATKAEALRFAQAVASQI